MTFTTDQNRSPLSQLASRLKQLGWVRAILATLVLLMALGLARYSWHLPLFLDAERALFDVRVFSTAPQVEQDDRIVQVVYTDETLRATGKRSPLDRLVLAKALQRIDQMGAKSIGIDILIDQEQPEDETLIAAFKGMKTPTFIAHASSKTAEDKILYWQQEFLENFGKRIDNRAVQPATIVIQADDDNVLRRWAEVVKGEPVRLPNALMPEARTFADYTGSVAYRLPLYQDRPVFGSIPIDTFADDAMFEIPEAAALMKQQIEGRYVLIGGHIADIDIFETPMTKATGKVTFGIEIFAHMLAQQLDGKAPAQVSANIVWLLAVLVVLAGALTAVLNASPALVTGAVLAQLGLLGGLPFWMQMGNTDTYGLPSFGWIAGWMLAFLAVGSAARALGSEQRKFAQSALGKYLPRDIAAQIMRDPDSLSLTGEKRELFVIFTDLEGFTKLSHAIEPEMVATLLNRYLDMLSDVVLRYGGTIDKFVGDAVVAFWGAPISRPDDGERAARAAIAMHEAGEEFRRSVPAGVPAIGKTRVGMHHGEAIVGNFGGEGRIQYTALGDSMNTAARLESANKQTKSNILVSRDAAELTGLDIFRPMGRIVLRGRATPIEIFEPVPDMPDSQRREMTEIIQQAVRGDVSAITALNDMVAKRPSDTALANLAYRLEHQEEGGYFVLD